MGNGMYIEDRVEKLESQAAEHNRTNREFDSILAERITKLEKRNAVLEGRCVDEKYCLIGTYK